MTVGQEKLSERDKQFSAEFKKALEQGTLEIISDTASTTKPITNILSSFNIPLSIDNLIFPSTATIIRWKR